MVISVAHCIQCFIAIQWSLIKEDNFVPTRWPLARVTQVHHGNDGLVSRHYKDSQGNV